MGRASTKKPLPAKFLLPSPSKSFLLFNVFPLQHLTFICPELEKGLPRARRHYRQKESVSMKVSQPVCLHCVTRVANKLIDEPTEPRKMVNFNSYVLVILFCN